MVVWERGPHTPSLRPCGSGRRYSPDSGQPGGVSSMPPSLHFIHSPIFPAGRAGGRARLGSWEALCRLATPCCQRGGTRRHRHTQSHAPRRLTFSSSCLSCFVRASREHMVCWGATTVQMHLPSLSWAELYTCQLSSGLVGSTWGAGGKGEGGRESETREHPAGHAVHAQPPGKGQKQIGPKTAAGRGGGGAHRGSNPDGLPSGSPGPEGSLTGTALSNIFFNSRDF